MASLLKLLARSLRKAWRGGTVSTHPFSQEEVDLEFSRLEPRRVLSADFALGTTLLNLHSFTGTANQNLSIVENGIFRDFTLQEGTWTNVGGSPGGILGAGTSTLSVPSTLLDTLTDGLRIDDTNAVGLNVQIDGLNLGGDLSLNVGSLELGSVKVGGDLFATTATSITDSANAVIDVAQNATLVSGSLAADFNSDGAVDGEDLGIWQDNYGANGASRELGDADGSGTITGRDFLIWQRQFQAAPDAASVIQLADGDAGNQLIVGGTLSLRTIGGQSIEVGVTSTSAAANAQVMLGSATFNTTQAGRVQIAADNALALVGTNQAGDVYLRSADSISEGATTNLAATSLAVRAGGDVNLLGDNKFDQFAAKATGSLNLVSRSPWDIAQIAVGTDLAEGTVTGIDVGANSVLLNVTEAVPSLETSVTQTAKIVSRDLVLRGSESFDLLHPENDIERLAADAQANIQFADRNGFKIDTIAGVAGVQIGDHELSLKGKGPVEQTDDGVIVASGLLIRGNGPHLLINPNNDIDFFAATHSGDLRFADRDGFVIGTVNTVTGATILGEFTLAFNSAGPVTQTARIATHNLLLEGSGHYTLTQADNDVFNLAAKTTASAYYRDKNGFSITTLKDAGDNDVHGIDVGANTLGLQAEGEVSQDAPILASALLLRGAGPYHLLDTSNNVATLAVRTTGDVYYTDTSGFEVGEVVDETGAAVAGARVGTHTLGLKAGGDVTQGSVAEARIEASGLLLLGPTAYNLTNASNEISVLAANGIGNLYYRNATGFTIGTISDASGVNVNGVNVGANVLGLNAGGMVDQTAKVIAGSVLLQGAGPYELVDPDNDVARLAVATAGDVAYGDRNGFVLGVVPNVTGAMIAGANVGGNTLALEAGGEVTQVADQPGIPPANIVAKNLLLQGAGAYVLTNAANNVTTLTANTENDIRYTDADNISIGAVNGITGLRIVDSDGSDNHSLSLVSMAGDITQDLFCSIDVDVAIAAFQVSNGRSIKLDDVGFEVATPVGLTGNRFFNDNPLVNRETVFTFTASTGHIGNISLLDQTAVDLPVIHVSGNLIVVGEVITDSATVAVDGRARFHATGVQPGTFVVDLDGLNVANAGGNGLAVTTIDGNVRIVNANSLRFLSDVDTNVVGDIIATATTGDITNPGGRLTATGEAQFNAANLINLSTVISGRIGLKSGGNTTLVNSSTIDFKTTEVGGNLVVTASTGDITNLGGTVTVAGEAQFTAENNINLSTQIAGRIGLASGQAAALINTTTIDFKTTQVEGNLDATALTGDITNTSGTLIVGGEGQFTAQNAIHLSAAIVGPVGLKSGGNATFTNASTIDFKPTNIGGSLIVTASTGNIVNGPRNVVVAGESQFSAANGAIDLRTDIKGTIALLSQADSSLNNLGDFVFRAAQVGGNLFATSETGDILDAASAQIEVKVNAVFSADKRVVMADENNLANRLIVDGHAKFLSRSNGDIDVGIDISATTDRQSLAESRFGGLSFATTGKVRIAEDVAATEPASVQGMELVGASDAAEVVLISAGSMTNVSRNLTVTDEAQFTALGMIDLQTDIRGAIGIDGKQDATLNNFRNILFKSSEVVGTLKAAATLGDISDRDGTTSIEVGQNATFTARDNITLADENSATNRLIVGGHATFESVNNGDLQLGVRSQAAALSETRFGQVTFITGDGMTRGGDVQIAEDIAVGEANATRGMLLTGDSKARSALLTSAGNIEDTAAARLAIVELTQLAVDRALNDIILGDGNDTTDASTNNIINLHDLDIVSARHASLQVDQQSTGQNLYIVGADLSGTLFVTSANNHIVQSSGSEALVANEAAFEAREGAVVLTRTEFNRFGAKTNKAIDVSTTVGDLAARVDRTVFDAIMAKLGNATPTGNLGDDSLEDADPSNDDLRPVRVEDTGTGRYLQKEGTDSQYSLILGENRGDLIIGNVIDRAIRVQDPGVELLGDRSGIEVDAGNAYLVTTNNSGDDNGDLHFTAAGVSAGQVVKIQGTGTFTAIAGGELTIDTNTSLVSATGVVKSVGPDSVFDGRLEGVEDKEGPKISMTPPTKDPGSPTSRIVYLEDKTQRIELEIGVDGEKGFLADVLWADAIGKLSPRTPANDITNVVGARDYQPERDANGVEIASTLSAGTKSFEKTFVLVDLLAGGKNANYPYLPTEIRVFSDPGINLYEGGNAANVRNLNRSIVALGAPVARMDNFILAMTSGEGPYTEEQRAPQQVVTYVAMPTQVTPLQNQVAFRLAAYSDSGTAAAYEYDDVEYGVVIDDKLDPEKTYKWQEGTKGDWKSEIQEEVRGDDKYEVGEYMIRATRVDGSSEEFPFTKDTQGRTNESDQGSRFDRLKSDQRVVVLTAREIWTEAWRNWRAELAEENKTSMSLRATQTESNASPGQFSHEKRDDGLLGSEALENRSVYQGFAAQSLVGGAMIIAKYHDRIAKNWRAPWVQHLARNARFTALQRARRSVRNRFD